MEKTVSSILSDEQYQDHSSSTEQFQAPEKDSIKQEIFNRYKNYHTIDEEEEQDKEVIFTIKDLDTGEEIKIENEHHHKEFENRYSVNLKKINGRMSAWENFWKNVYKNSQALRASCEKGQLQAVKKLVMNGKNGYPVELNSKGLDDWTALHYAAYEGHLEILQFLLQHEANINAVTKFGRTSLHISAMRGHIKIIKRLCDYGIDIDFQDQDGNTAIHIAAQNSQTQIVEYLVKFVKQLKGNKAGLTPADVATAGETKQVFKKYGFRQSQRLSQLLIQKQYPQRKMTEFRKQSYKQQNNIQRIRLSAQNLTPDSFIYYKQLGKGSFGQVYLVERKSDPGKLYAMKVLAKDKIFGKNLVRYALAQRNVLSGMNHPFIVKLNYAFQDQMRLFLVMDFCPGGDLGKLLTRKKSKCLPQSQAKLYLSEIVLAFQALHKNMIVFRDLKPDNVVIDAEGHARLTDFGLSKQGIYNNTTQSFLGSLAYLAPEILNKQGHSRTVDWYLMGLLVYQLLVGIPPYYNSQKEVLFENIKRGPLKIPKTMSQNAKDLIKKLLHRDPKKRLGAIKDAEEIKLHPFFDGINWSDALNRKLPVPPIDMPKINLNVTLNINFENKSFEDAKRIQDWTFIDEV